MLAPKARRTLHPSKGTLVKRSLRYVLAAGLAAAALGSVAPAAEAAACYPPFEEVCYQLGVACRELGDNPKYHDVFCPPLG